MFDVIVSFSAPVVFRQNLLGLPKYGCINLHCSLLPLYSGIMPSFWVLFYKESYTGATIHMMDTKIDNGDILAQKRVEIYEDDSMFEIIRRTKGVGGRLMVDTLNK